MEESVSNYFYKYRMIDNAIIEKAKQNNNYSILLDDYSIKALFNNYAVFSSRKNFNDVFDSKLYFIKPTPQEVKKLKKLVSKDRKLEIDKYISKGKFTNYGNDRFQQFIKGFNELFDSYPIYSLSKNCTNNLMWSHYANSHYGFCIEFKAEFMNPHKIQYQKSIPNIYLIDFIKDGNDFTNPVTLTNHIIRCLNTKLDYWSYEDEYRLLAGNAMQDIESKVVDGKMSIGEKYVKYQYKNEWIESIIFGCRMDEKVKEFIKTNIPFPVKFKRAVINMEKSVIEIESD